MANQTVYPYGTDGQLPSSIGIINDLTTGGADKALSAEMGKEIGNILGGENEPVESTWGDWNLSTISPYRAFTIAGSKTVVGGVISVKLTSYSTYKIAVTVQNGADWTSETITDTGWQTSDVTKTITSEEAGYNIRVSIGRVDNASINLTEFLSAISEISYTYLSGYGLVDRVEELENKIAATSLLIDIIPEYIVSGEEEIDLSMLPESTGTVIATKVWTTSAGKHKVISVTPGDKYVIYGDGNGFWGWFSSSYSAPVTDGASVPYATGYANRVLQKDAVAVTVPSGVSYLMLVTVNGSGNRSNWRVWSVESYKRRTTEMAKLRMAHWNIGQFVYTDWTVGGPTHTIPAADAATYAQKYRELIDSIDADIFGIAEYYNKFSAADWVTKDVLFQCFSHAYEGNKRGANCNSVFSNIMEWVGQEEILFPSSSYNRYYTHITARFLGENIHIVEAHLDHTYNEMRVPEIQKLIEDMAPYKYVIIGGDFNTNDEETVETEFGYFKTAGYTLLNSDYLGLIITSLTQEYVDNIIVKGFTMSNRQTNETSGTLSDHLLLFCDLTMQDI